MKHEFKETGQSIYEFTGEMFVHCPRCDKCATIVIWPPDARDQIKYAVGILLAPKRLICKYCGYVKDTQPPPWDFNSWWYSLRDPYFGSSLWLQTSCCGEVLWAFNKEHLDFLEEFVGAGLREAYPNGTMASRLPEWMKRAKNREDVLKCIRKLRAMLP